MSWLRILPPIIVLALCFGAARHFVRNPAEAPKRPAPRTVLTVEGSTITRENFQVEILTQGNVEPHTETRLIPQVAGYLIRVAPAFRDGGLFHEGDLLVEIDPSDYRTALIDAEANLAQAEANLETEQARADQALENWNDLNIGMDPNPLALRKPQLAQAQAAVASASARVEKARRDLERTRITAPYDGRIRGKGADVGQFVSVGTTIASIFAVDYVEVRLPIPPADTPFIDLPETYSGEPVQPKQQPEVHFFLDLGDTFESWTGKIVRTEGVVDTRSRQIIAVARIHSPYAVGPEGRSPLKLGQFLRARVSGRLLEDRIVVPRSVVRDDDHVYVISSSNRLVRKSVRIVRADAKSDRVVIEGDVMKGDVLCITPVPFAVDGIEVNAVIDGRNPQIRNMPGGQENSLKEQIRPSGRKTL